ncbi:MAG: peptidase T [Oscillospiraceae bacterium]|jgi:tripeptide aminopeptidase
MTIQDRFLNYVRYDTQSREGADSVPSTENQWALGKALAQELSELGAQNVSLDAHCIVTAFLPANCENKNAPALGLIAHMDTSPDAPGKNIRPQIIENYDGGVISLGKSGLTLDPANFPILKKHVGETLVTTDGTTLLGADDKAGIAEIMQLLEYFRDHPEAKHGKLCIAFTPDEEVGGGEEAFDPSAFGADFAYTLDGDEMNEIQFENFNAANAGVFVNGKSIHPGSAKNIMVNAALVALEYAALLPQAETPAHTEGYEGFYHLHQMSGSVEDAQLQYIIRDHDKESFLARKQLMQDAADFLNKKYGPGTVEVVLKDSYFNMREKIEPHPELIELAQQAMRDCGVTPEIIPIRGGTDGAKLSFRGLPCPNLGTGGGNYHGPYEFCSLTAMEKAVEVLVRLTALFADQKKS